jgi:hypothetical protein
VLGGDAPDLVGVDAVVVVGEDDAEPGDVAPGDARVLSGRLFGQAVCGLADDVEEALGGTAEDRVGVEGLAAAGDDTANSSSASRRSASRSSSERVTGSQGDGSEPDVLVPRFEAADRYDVDRYPEELGEFVLEVQEIEQGATRLEVDQEVDVAPGAVLIPRRRPEDGDRPAAVTPGQSGDLGPVLVDERSARSHVQRVTLRRSGPTLPARCGLLWPVRGPAQKKGNLMVALDPSEMRSDLRC